MKRKTKLVVLVILITLFMIVGVSYSFFSANISYVSKTDTKLRSNVLGLKFDGKDQITCNNMIPGDKCIKTFEVENTSEVETFYNIYMENITNEFDSDLVYTLKEGNTEVVAETVAPVTNSSKTYVKANIAIPSAPGKHTYTLTMSFKYKEEQSQNINQGATFKATIGIDTVQGITIGGGDNPVVGNYKCIRATTLHTAECQGTCQYTDVGQGATITYGNQTTTPGTLAAGDAFDCKVSTSGDYTERFYYVADQDANTAVLIYSNNVSAGLPDNTTTYYQNSREAFTYGPISTIGQLPTTTQWDNVSLTSTTRDIKDQTGTTRVTGFEYKKDGTDLAARYLTTGEVGSACGITVGTKTMGELDRCLYLLENTMYQDDTLKNGYWLENVSQTRSEDEWFIYPSYRNVSNSEATGSASFAVRPAIEVAKTDIQY